MQDIYLISLPSIDFRRFREFQNQILLHESSQSDWELVPEIEKRTGPQAIAQFFKIRKKNRKAAFAIISMLMASMTTVGVEIVKVFMQPGVLQYEIHIENNYYILLKCDTLEKVKLDTSNPDKLKVQLDSLIE